MEGKNKIDEGKLNKDFIMDEIVELDLPDNKGFKFKKITGGDMNDWIPKITSLEGNGIKENTAELNKLRMLNIVGVPYSAEEIQKVLDLNGPLSWSGLSDESKWKFISKMNPELFSKVVEAMTKFDSGSDAKKKSL